MFSAQFLFNSVLCCFPLMIFAFFLSSLQKYIRFHIHLFLYQIVVSFRQRRNYIFSISFSLSVKLDFEWKKKIWILENWCFFHFLFYKNKPKKKGRFDRKNWQKICNVSRNKKVNEKFKRSRRKERLSIDVFPMT